ncbi:WD40-repeat-containing domain protein [Suillus discolor]|uniref:WD40-repeat-containing domain protein n=1 Tax=Suillus discolor TaxID=1912936 RepID=A0A9P7JLV6_9AGAM|nr:WD40-repeat-containing domain protein [Suillus discolor]KAG2087197.1 WD40-repeat-containing domain protein [Suillus discolor]
MSVSDVKQDFGPEISMSRLPDEPKSLPSKYFLGHTDPLTCVALFPDSKMIITGSYDRRIRLWDVGSGQAIGEPLRGHKVSVNVIAVSPNGTMFVSGGGDGRILIWNATTRNLATAPIQAHSNRINSISFSPDSATIASIAGTIIKIWDVGTAKLIMDIKSTTSERQVAFSPEGSRIASVSHLAPDQQMLRIWDVKTGKPAAVNPIAGHTGGLLSVAWFPNGQRLVTASLDRTIRVWISETGRQEGHSLGGDAAWMADYVAVSSDGKLIAALCGDQSIRLWNAITLDQKLVLQHAEPVLCMAISADIRFIVGGCGDKKLCLWNIENITQDEHNSRPLSTLGPEKQEDSAPDSSLPDQSPMNLMYPEVQSGPEQTVSQAVITSHGPLPLEPPTTAKEDTDPVASPAEHSHFRKWWRQAFNFWNAGKHLSSQQRIAEIEPRSDEIENVITNQGQSPAQDILDEFNRYVMNEIPIHLIYLPTMELVGRNFVKNHFQDRIKEITEDLVVEAQARFVPPLTREKVVPTLVRRKVEYGILSHRWLDSGEPSYQDMMERKLSGSSGPSNVGYLLSNITSRPKDGRHTLHTSHSENKVQSPGYKKLQKCCEEARRLDLHFLWSDTCCIDKNSSAELDESIRSMFRWYRNSSICIAYLGGTTVIEDLRLEEWFMRGWTLQELLAPRKIKFFNKDWQRLTDQDDDKEEDTPLMTVLQEVTGIPETELIDFEPTPHYIDKRMTWAAQRITTRAEDVAYSLMGMFDVSLQIAYGEGGERAFGRLIEAIMQAGGYSSVLNWAGEPAKHHASFALPASPLSYVGHPDIVSIGRLDMMLTSRGLRIPLVIVPLEMAKPEFDGHPIINPKFYCTHHGIGEVKIDTRGYRFKAMFREYALGIFHYIPAEDSQNPGLPKQVAAYLLERSEVNPQEDIPVGLSRQYRSFEDGWRRVPTGFIYVELPGVPDFASLWYIDRTCLETVYL